MTGSIEITFSKNWIGADLHLNFIVRVLKVVSTLGWKLGLKDGGLLGQNDENSDRG